MTTIRCPHDMQTDTCVKGPVVCNCVYELMVVKTQHLLALVNAAKAISKYLHHSEDRDDGPVPAIYILPVSGGTQLRRDADAADRKDAAILAFRHALWELREGQ